MNAARDTYGCCFKCDPAADTHVADLVVDPAAFERVLALVCG